MGDGIFRQPKTRAQIGSVLLNDLLQKQLDWKQAPAQDRNATRQQFMHALDRFSTACSERADGARHSFKLIQYRFPVHGGAGVDHYEERQN